MLNEEFGLMNVEEDLLVSIYKSLEIYDIIQDTRLKIDNERISKLDKKYLSLLLGIYFNKNSVSSMLRLLRYDYGIQVYTKRKTEEQYIKIYRDNFKDILEEMLADDDSIENFMLKLIEVDFIKRLHYNRGISLMSIEMLLKTSINNKEKEKTLQKKQNVLL